MPIVAAAVSPHPPIILPQIGKGEEKKIAETDAALRDAMRFVAAFAPETVVIVSPHAEGDDGWFQLSFGDGAWGDFSRFGAPRAMVEARYDTNLVAGILSQAKKAGIPANSFEGGESELDHGTGIPLVYLLNEYTGCKIVRIALSGLPLEAHYRMGICIAKAAGTRPVAIIASGDLSHKLREDGPYGFAPEGPRLDRQITDALSRGDFGALMNIEPALAAAAGECGLRSLIMMAGALDGRPVEARLLSYQDTFGVGYAVATFRPYGEDEARRFLARAEAEKRRAQLERQRKEDVFVGLARYGIETYLDTGGIPALPPGLPPQLAQERAGVFVSLHKDGELRGCVGTVEAACACVGAEILQNAVSAAVKDSRFSPVRPEETDFLEIKVDILGETEDIDSPLLLDVKRYGVVAEHNGRRGLLLPDLDGVDTPQKQIEIACQKAGIPAGVPLQLRRFEVERHR